MIIPVTWNTKNKFCIARVHYSCDPEKNTPEWLEKAKRGSSDKSWQREYEISYDVFEGKPVFDEFGEQHIKAFEYNVEQNQNVFRSWDFGFHHPACLLSFMNSYDQLCFRSEIMGHDENIKDFGIRVRNFSLANFPGAKWLDCCDPAGASVKDTSETSVQVLNSLGIYPIFRKSFIAEGLEIIRQRLKIRNDGRLGVIFHPDCKITIDGMKGGYRFGEIREGQAEKEEPLKDGFFDHLMDCARYTCINYLELAPTPGIKTSDSIENDIMSNSSGLGMNQYF
jgi:hypothetical protein